MTVDNSIYLYISICISIVIILLIIYTTSVSKFTPKNKDMAKLNGQLIVMKPVAIDPRSKILNPTKHAIIFGINRSDQLFITILGEGYSLINTLVNWALIPGKLTRAAVTHVPMNVGMGDVKEEVVFKVVGLNRSNEMYACYFTLNGSVATMAKPWIRILKDENFSDIVDITPLGSDTSSGVNVVLLDKDGNMFFVK